MTQNKSYPEWFLWIAEKGPLFVSGIGLMIMVCIIAVGVYFDQRLGQVEDKLDYVPPRSYEMPNLADYAVGDFDVDTLPVRKQVYVPVYSHVYFQGGAPYLLETTLSIRNVSPQDPVYLQSVQYFDTTGNLVQDHLDETIRLAPLQTIEFLVEEQHSSGGSGANFLVEWRGTQDSEKPLVEAVMVGTSGTQGISFVRSGVELSRTP